MHSYFRVNVHFLFVFIIDFYGYYEKWIYIYLNMVAL